MKIIAKTLLMVVFTLFCGESQAQNNKIIKSLEQRNRLIPQEKVYIHFDKSVYSLGDTIWLQAYVVNAINNLPTGLSNDLYIDILDDKSQS